MVNELQRDKGQRGASVAPGLGGTTDDLLLPVARRDLLDALMGERRARTVAWQPFQSGPVVAGDALRGVEREAAAGPGEHVAGIIAGLHCNPMPLS